MLDQILNRNTCVLVFPLFRVVSNCLEESLGIFITIDKLIDAAIQKSQTTQVILNIELQQKFVFSFFLSILLLFSLFSDVRIVIRVFSRSASVANSFGGA